ncbi:MAG: hypothetical protein SFY32_14915 [Bacteroidota bacterium]|nr:hypothetical protein [Bacteroidota bacterium]
MKKYFPYLYHLFYWVGALMMIVGNFFIIRHLSVANIGLLVFGIGWVLQVIIDRKIPNRSYSPWIMFCFWGLILVQLIGILINNESPAVMRYVLSVPSIIFGYSAISALAPVKPIQFYTLCFYAFIITCVIIDTITCYNYVNLIYIHHAEGLHPTWVNLIDMLYDKIIPFFFYHHTLGVLNVFGLLLIFALVVNKQVFFTPLEKYIQWVFAAIILVFIHLLSARIAIFCFYVIALAAVYYYRENLKWKSIFLIGTIVLAITVLGFAFIPMMNTKIWLTINEIKYYFNASTDQIISGPIYRLKFQLEAIQLIKQNFLTGIGFEQKDAIHINPHNMFLFYAISIGVPLTLLFAILTYLPIFMVRNTVTFPIIGIFIIHTFYSLTDNGMDILLYLYFYAFWVPFMFQYRKVLLQ